MRPILSREQWREFVASRGEANFLQSLEWGLLHESLGHNVVRYGIESKQGELVGGWQGIVKDARRGRYLEVPGSPLIDWTNEDVVAEAVKQLRGVGKKYKCTFIRIRPQLIDSDDNRIILQRSGFKKAPFHLHAEHTNILDLSEPEDEILRHMRRQTRYEVRRATKQDIDIEVMHGVDAIDEFYAIQSDTAARQGFVPSSHTFLKTMADSLGDNLKIYRASKDGQLLNMAIVIWSGQEADYFEAASTPESRSFAGAYGLQWRAICDAKAAGLVRYNFWGIAYSDDPKHRYAGVTTFKRGFGGQDTTYIPAHDLVISRIGYVKNWIVETIRRKKRRL